MTNELTTTSIMALFETTKEQRQSFVSDIIQKVEDGDIDPLKIQVQLKCAEDIIKQVTGNDRYKNLLVESAQTYGSKSFEAFNAKMEIKETGVKYDFSNCGDVVLDRLTQQQESTDKAVKDRQTFLKTIPVKGLVVTDDETGETFTVYPPAKSSTTNVAISLK